MRPRLLASVALGAAVPAFTANASCVQNYETVVRGRLARCESVQFHWDARGTDRVIEEMLERSLANTRPDARERRRERWREQGLLPGMRRPTTSLVAVVRVEHQASTLEPWSPESGAKVQLRDAPRSFYEMVRYLWLGPAETCENTADWPSVDLWITYACCDTPDLPGEDGCLLNMNYAAPAPAPMREALSKALADTSIARP